MGFPAISYAVVGLISFFSEDDEPPPPKENARAEIGKDAADEAVTAPLVKIIFSSAVRRSVMDSIVASLFNTFTARSVFDKELERSLLSAGKFAIEGAAGD